MIHCDEDALKVLEHGLTDRDWRKIEEVGEYYGVYCTPTHKYRLHA